MLSPIACPGRVQEVSVKTALIRIRNSSREGAGPKQPPPPAPAQAGLHTGPGRFSDHGQPVW